MHYLKLYPVIVLFFTGAIITGCDNSLNPVNRDKGLYSIYGFLDIDKNTNYIRIKDLNTPLVEDSTRTIDAEVTITNLANDNSDVLKDSVVNFEGVNTHNFYTDMSITPKARYRVTIERSDGKAMSVVASTPGIASTNAAPINKQCSAPITFSFDPVLERKELALSLGFELFGQKYWTTPDLSQDEDNGERIYTRISPKQIIDEVFPPEAPGVEEKFCYQLSSPNIFVKYTHYGPDYFEDKATDSLAIPGGAGEFGGGYDRSFSVPIDTTRLTP